MPSPRFEVPAGAVNGVNTVFTVSMPYGPGSTAVFINGMLMERSLDDGWFETNPGAGVVTLKEAPRGIGNGPDVIQIFFIDTSPALPETVVVNIKGIIRVHRPLRGTLRATQSMTGHVAASASLLGHLDVRKDLRGSISARPQLKATIKVCV
jgi:hypothetical protein